MKYDKHEFLAVKIKSFNINLIIMGIYISPSPLAVYKKYCNIIESISIKYYSSSLVIFGDFNLPLISWSNEDNLLTCEPMVKAAPEVINAAACIREQFSELGMQQVHPNHPVKGYSLDLVFTSTPCIRFRHDLDAIVPQDKEHHLSGTFDFSNVCVPLKPLYHVSRYNFNKIDINLLNQCLYDVNWIEVFNFEIFDINNCINFFYDLLYELIEITVPKLKFKNNNFPTWYSKDLIKCIIDKKIAHLNWQKTNDNKFLIEFKRLRAKSICLSRENYNEYMKGIESSIKGNTGAFWRYVNGRRDHKSIPSEMYSNEFDNSDKFINDPEISEGFATFFSSVYKKQYDKLINTDSNNIVAISSVSSIDIHVEDIELAIRTLRLVGPGPDMIPPIFLKSCSKSITFPLLLLYKQSLKTGIFPDKWKLSYITPVFKSGSRTVITNYRPVCAISAFAKLFESIVYEKFYARIYQLISVNQHGFMRNRSIVTNLLGYTSVVLDSLEKGAQVDVIYYDFAKAFDCVDHSILISKLNKMGVSGCFLQWIRSYLSNRFQSVKIRNSISSSFFVPSGVPQGSNLGPLLFLLFINDITECVNHSFLDLFADDLRMYKKIEIHTDFIDLQSDIDKIFQWSVDNNMDLSIHKCRTMSIYRGNFVHKFNYMINGNVLDRVDVVRDLGIYFDSGWTFDNHIEFITSKASKLIGFIKRTTFKFRSIALPSTLKKALSTF